MMEYSGPHDSTPVVEKEHVVKHLEMLQLIINEYPKRSLMLRSSLIVILSSLYFRTAQIKLDSEFSYMVFVLIFLFWLLDGYYRKQHRLYQKLYETTRDKHFPEKIFSMRINKIDTLPEWWITLLNGLEKLTVLLAPPLFIFYSTIALSSYIITTIK